MKIASRLASNRVTSGMITAVSFEPGRRRGMHGRKLNRSRIPGIRGRAGGAALALAIMLALAVLPTGSAQAQTFTTFDSPGAGTGPFQGTAGLAINTAEDIAGAYVDANSVYHGFVRLANGTITTFSALGAGKGALQGTA